MSDIFGRSIPRPADIITRPQIASMIKKYVTSGLNLVDVDPGEIVVFENDKGKLKTSNISFDSLLTRPEGVADNSIAVFKQGKIAAGDKLSSITDKLTIVNDTAADLKKLNDDMNKFIGIPKTVMTRPENYLTAFTWLKRNFDKILEIIDKLLTIDIKEIKLKDLNVFLNTITTIKKITDDITAINSKLGVWVDTNPITASITNIKQDITDIKTITDTVKVNSSKLDKIKTTHTSDQIKISYMLLLEELLIILRIVLFLLI